MKLQYIKNVLFAYFMEHSVSYYSLEKRKFLSEYNLWPRCL